MKKLLFIFSLLSQLSLFSQNANISFEVETDHIFSSDDDCWDFVGNEEYTANVRITGSTVGSYKCMTADDASGGASYGFNTFLKSESNVDIQEIISGHDIFEDDGGSRCTYDSGDDCRAFGSNPFSIIAGSYPDASSTYNGTYSYSASIDHDVYLNYSWRYAGGTSVTPNCTASSLTCSLGEIRSQRILLTAGTTYEFETTSGADTYLRLFAADGYTIVASDDDGGSGASGLLSLLTYTPTSSGTYYIEISEYSRNALSSDAVLSYKQSDLPPTSPTSITGTSTICDGVATSLTATGGSEGSGCTYQWGTGSTVGSNIIPGAISNSYNASPNTNTTYWVRRTGTICSGNTGGVTKTITVNSLPTVDAGSVLTDCDQISGSLSGSASAGSTGNVATSATVTASGGGSGTYGFDSQTNNGVNPGCTTSPFAWVSSNGYVDLTWASAQNIQELIIHRANRPYTSFTLQYWNGSSFVNTGYSYSASPACTETHTLPSPVSTTILRINAIAGSNPNFHEFEVMASMGTIASTVWSPSTGLSSSTSLTPSCTATATTTYTLTAVDGNGCSNSDQVTVTVNSSPTAVITNNESGSSTEVTCVNTGISISASGGGTYSWDNSLGSSANQNITSAGTYTVTVTDNGCTDTENIIITENTTAPTAVITNNETGNTSVITCDNPQISVTASGGSAYSWDNSLGSSANQDLSSAATYTVTVTSASNGCTDTESLTTTENTTVPTVDAGTFSDICDQANGTFNATTNALGFGPNIAPLCSNVTRGSGGSTNYGIDQIIDGNNSTCTGAPYAWVGTGSYIEFEWSGNQSIAGLTIYRADRPYTGFDIQYWNGSSFVNTGYSYSASPACVETHTLSNVISTSKIRIANLAGTNPNFHEIEVLSSGGSVSWSPSTSLSSTTTLNPTCSVTTTTTYTLTVTSGNGCSASDQVTVNINSANAGITNNESASSTEVTCANTGISISATGGGTYSWDNSLGSSANQNITTAGTYTVTVTDNGCSDTENITVTENTTPPLQANNLPHSAGLDYTGLSMCGKTSQFITGTQPTGIQTVLWTVLGGGAFANPPTDQTTEIEPNLQSAYGSTITVRYTVENSVNAGGNGCTSIDEMEIEWTQPSTSVSGMSAVNGDLLFGGLSSTDWNNGTNWYKFLTDQNINRWERITDVNTMPANNNDVYIMPSTSDICVSDNNDVLGSISTAHNITVDANATLNMGSGELTITGDLTNNGTINLSDAKLIMNGTSDQAITSVNGLIALDELEMNIAGNLITSINTPIEVLSKITMLSGNINNESKVTLGASSSNFGILEHNEGIIFGAFERYFPNTSVSNFHFPVGDNNTSNPTPRDAFINFANSPGLNQSLTMNFKSGYPTAMANNYNGLPFSCPDGQLIQNYSNEGYYDIMPDDANGGGYNALINSAPYTIKMRAKDIVTVTDRNLIRLIKSPGPAHNAWYPVGYHVLVDGSSNSDFYVTAGEFNGTPCTGFSFFGFGGDDSNNPLPVDLVSFNGDCGDGVVELNWTTASEHNSSHYELDKSIDGENWNTINTQDAAGNSNQMLSYAYTDDRATSGNNYYRLTQFDIDGESKEYPVINISCVDQSVGYFSTHPNPSTGEFHVVINDEKLIGNSTIRIVDSRGVIITQKELHVQKGTNVFMMNEFKALPGMYYITVVNGNNVSKTIKQSIR